MRRGSNEWCDLFGFSSRPQTRLYKAVVITGNRFVHHDELAEIMQPVMPLHIPRRSLKDQRATSLLSGHRVNFRRRSRAVRQFQGAIDFLFGIKSPPGKNAAESANCPERLQKETVEGNCRSGG